MYIYSTCLALYQTRLRIRYDVSVADIMTVWYA